MNVAVIGIGRVGLPIAAAVALRGHQVIGCDIDPDRVDSVRQARNPWPDEHGLSSILQTVVGAGHLKATTDTVAGVANADVVLFAVAVDVDDRGVVDLRPLEAATDAAARGIKKGALCILDTTLPVSTTRTALLPRLERSGYRLGEDLFVAFSPERLMMGRVIEDITKYPKVVGGVDAESGRRASSFFKTALGVNVIELESAEAAELTKLAEGAYRDLNIALANELAQVADIWGVDVSEVFRAANSQPFSHLHTPGTGVGGHCIPVYPQFLIKSEGPSTLAAAGREVNDSMPGYGVKRLEEALGSLEGKRVVVMGLTFRPDVAVTAHTNAVGLLRELLLAGAIVHGHDPLLTPEDVRSLGFDPAPAAPAGYDAVIVHALHEGYRGLGWGSIAPVLLDARNALDRREVEDSGSIYIGIGRPASSA